VVADEEWGGPEDLAGANPLGARRLAPARPDRSCWATYRMVSHPTENLSDAQSAPLPTLWPQDGRSWRAAQEKGGRRVRCRRVRPRPVAYQVDPYAAVPLYRASRRRPELNFEEDALFVAGPERDDDDDRKSRVAPQASYAAASASASATPSPQPRAVLDSLPELEDYDDAVDEAAGALNAAALVTGPDGDNELGDPSMSIMPADA